MARISVTVQPRAAKSAITGLRDGRLHVRIAAPPADGLANEELVSTLAAAMGIRRSAVQVVKGHTSRHKVVEVDASEATLAALLRP